jgi:hypothetical protein
MNGYNQIDINVKPGDNKGLGISEVNVNNQNNGV